MKILFLTTICILFGISYVFAQKIHVKDKDSYALFKKQLDSSKDIRYQTIVKAYDDYLTNHSNDIEVQIYKCKFIGTAYYDDYEDYDPNWEVTDSCIETLYKNNKENPKVIIYKLQNIYGEKLEIFLEKSLAFYETNNDAWNDLEASKLFEIASNYYVDENEEKALRYALKAKRYNEDLDNSLTIAKIYTTLGDTENSREALISGLDYDSEAWVLNQKAELLITLEEYKKAIALFERVYEKDSSYVNNTNLYKIFVNQGAYNKARNYLVKDTLQSWSKASNIQKLLHHDIQYSSSQVALETYSRMQQESYYDDFFGIKRIKIFLKSPFSSFSTVGFSHLFILLLLIIILFIVPYLWVMPIYGLAKFFKLNFKYANFWNLKHFWLISFVYLAIQFIIIFVFYYESTINDYFGISYSYDDTTAEVLIQPNELIWFSVLSLIGTLLFLNKKRFLYAFTSNWSIIKTIRHGFAFLIFNLIFLKVLGIFIDISETSVYISLLSIKQEIALLLTEKGFFVAVLIVAVFAPVYEEIIFRGIILNSVSKHLGFNTANIIQALLFAAIHYHLPLFPFYFVFGLVTGYVVKHSNGLLPGIIFHAMNNFLVVLSLYALTN